MGAPIIPVPPGATIEELLIDDDISHEEFAKKMGMSQTETGKLLKGTAKLTPDVARRLGIILGVPAKFWLERESIYRKKQKEVARWEREQRI